MKKLRQKTGETIAETLVAVLIIAIAFVILTGAVAAAARVNERIKNDEEAFQDAGLPDESSISFSLKVYQQTILSDGVDAGTASAMLHYKAGASDGYYYYG